MVPVKGRPRRTALSGGLAALVLVVVYLVRAFTTTPNQNRAGPVAIAPAAPAALADAFRARRTSLAVTTGGRVVRVLPDDRDGARHERFLLRAEGITVLVAHNIDLAPRVPLVSGDSVELSGEYEWNAKGGVLHWTHRDPDGGHRAGWIRHDGRLFQ